MSVLTANQATLLDVTRTLDPNGMQADIAEILHKDNEVLRDMTWSEGNLITGDRTTVRTSLPGVGFRRLNEGVARGKSTSRQIDEASAMLEAFSQVDRKVAILSQNIAKYRASEGEAFLEAMNQAMASTLFFGNSTTSPKEFTGFAPRYNSLSGPTADQIIDGGGTGTDNRSIWLIGWAPNKVEGIYPKGTKGGLFHNDVTSNTAMGDDGFPIGDVVQDASGNDYLAYRDHWEWNCGLKVKDPRYVIRIPNIDVSLLTRDISTGAHIQMLMVQALERIQAITPSAAFYMPRIVREYLRTQLLNVKNPYLAWDMRAGERVMSFGEVPVRRTDALNVDEARVT